MIDCDNSMILEVCVFECCFIKYAGKESVKDAPNMDSAALYAMIFGSEKFDDIVGKNLMCSKVVLCNLFR